MRALGYVYTPLAIAAWYATSAIMAIIFLVPAVRGVEMPFYGGSIFQAFLDFSVMGAMFLVASNLFAGRWGPESMRRADLWATRIGLFTMIIIGLAVFMFEWGREGLPPYANYLYLGVTVFAFADYMWSKGEDVRATSMRGAGAAQNAAAGATAPGVTLPVNDQLMNIFSSIGNARLGPFNDVYVEPVQGGGGIFIEIPQLTSLRLAPPANI